MLKSIYNWAIGGFAVFWMLFIFIDYWQSHQVAYTLAFEFFQFSKLTFGLLLVSGGAIFGILWAKKNKKKLPIINGLGMILLAFFFILMVSSSVLDQANAQPALGPSDYLSLLTRVFFVAASLFIFLILPAYCIGAFIMDQLKTPIRKAELGIISIALGIVSLVMLAFILGIFGALTPFILYPILALILGVFWKKALFFLKNTLWNSITLDKNLGIIGLISFFLTVFFVAINFVQIIRPYPFGFDALSIYVNLPSLIYDYGALVEGYQPYNWSLWMALGYILFGKTEFVLALSFSGGLLSLFVFYQIARKWLNINYALLCVLLFYSLPSINFQSYKDMKIDLGLLYITLCIVLLLINWVTQTFTKKGELKSNEKPIEALSTQQNSFFSFLKKHELVILMGILSGFGLGMKFTMMFVLVSLLSAFWYAYNGKLAFMGAFCLGMAIILILKIDDMSGARDYHLFADTLQWILLLIGVVLIGLTFFRNRSGFFQSIKISVLYTFLMVMMFSPWPIKNAIESDKIDSRTILFGAPTGPQLNLRTLERNYEKTKTN